MSDAKFVLVIEKEATFDYLVSSGFVNRHGPCLLITVSMRFNKLLVER